VFIGFTLRRAKFVEMCIWKDSTSVFRRSPKRLKRVRVSTAYPRSVRLIDSPPSRSSCEYESLVITLTWVAGGLMAGSEQWKCWRCGCAFVGNTFIALTLMGNRQQPGLGISVDGKAKHIKLKFVIRVSRKGHFVHSFPQERRALSSSTISSPYALFLHF
jgi:hypothetical protein